MTADRDELLERCTSLVASPPPFVIEGRTRHLAARAVLDALGCAHAAHDHPVPTVARTMAARRQVSGGAQLIGGGAGAVSAEMAAFANGVMVRYLDLNDSYGSPVGVGHPSDYIPAALASAESSGADGPATLDAISIAYEVFCRLTDATCLGVDQWDHVVNGAVASAAAAARLGGLDRRGIQHALAIALVSNVALQATRLEGVSMWKGCAAANAARNGVFAAELAAEGLSGPLRPFEGRGGLFAATGRHPDTTAWERTSPALAACSMKRFPAGFFSQSAIDAAMELVGGGLDPDRIASIEVGTFSFAMKVMAGDPEKWRPATRESADHSLPFVVASTLARGRFDFDSLSRDSIHDPVTSRLLGLLHVSSDDHAEKAWPEAASNRVTVTLQDGTRLSAAVDFYRGHAGNPMSDSEIEAKFLSLSVPVLGEARSEAVARAVWALEMSGTARGLLDVYRNG